MTSVISVKGKKGDWGASLEKAPKNVVYVGRDMNMGGWKLKKSIYANPFKVDKYDKKKGFIKQHGTLDEVCEKYREYVLSNPELLKQLKTLKGKQLGCWCKPNRCHGDILKELIEDEELVKKRLKELEGSEEKEEKKKIKIVFVDSDGNEIKSIYE